MSNLGMYQTMVTLAKKSGGPLPFMVLLVGGGIVLGIAIDKVASLAKNDMQPRKAAGTAPDQEKTIYVVDSRVESDSGLVLEAGDQIKVLEVDGDAVLIDKVGDDDSPYVVSGDLLAAISAYSSNHVPA